MGAEPENPKPDGYRCTEQLKAKSHSFPQNTNRNNHKWRLAPQLRVLQVSRKLAMGRQARRGTFRALPSFLCGRPLQSPHSSGCISYRRRGCCPSPGRGRSQLLLDVWAASCLAFSACLGLSCGNGGCGLDSQPGDSESISLQQLGGTVEKYRISGGWKAEIIPGTSTPRVSRNVLVFQRKF